MLYLYTYCIHIVNALHNKYLLAKSKNRIYHIFLDGGYMSRGYFAMGLLSSWYTSGGICTGVYIMILILTIHILNIISKKSFKKIYQIKIAIL